MKSPIVRRSTMQSALQDKDRQLNTLHQQYRRDRERSERDIDEIIRPAMQRMAKVSVETRHDDQRYAIHMLVDQRMYEAMRHLPERAIEAMARCVAVQIIRTIEQEALRPHRV